MSKQMRIIVGWICQVNMLNPPTTHNICPETGNCSTVLQISSLSPFIFIDPDPGIIPSSGWLYLLVACIAIYYWWIAGRKWARRFNKLEGPFPLPFLGCGYLILNPYNVHQTVRKFATKYKNGRFWLGHLPYFITMDVQVIEKILSNPLHAEKAEAYSTSHFLVGHGLVAASIDKWRKDRKIMLPCLKSSMFSGYLENFNKNADILRTTLEKAFFANSNAVDIRQHFARCMIDIVFETLLDFPVNLQKHPESQFYEAFTACFNIVESKMFLPWVTFPPLWHLLGYASAEKRNMDIIKKTINPEMIHHKIQEWERLTSRNDNPETGNNSTKKMSLAHHLYQHRSNDVDDIFHQFLTVLAGGYDTTSTVLNHTVYLLALNQDIQDKVVEELESVFDGDNTRPSTTTDLEQLHYMEMVLKESMRFITPTPILGRTLGADLDIGCGQTVPAGCNVLIPAIHVQRDPDLWRDPEVFKPERFQEDSNNRNPYSYLPFSGGLRGCFAPKFAMMSMKVILCRVFRNFTFSTKKPLDSCVFRYGVVLHVKGGLPVTLHPRTIQ